MKTKFLIAFAFVATLFSCSSDDGGSGGGITNYFPLEDGYFWKYNVSLDATAAGQDHLFVGNDTLIDATTYKIMKTEAQAIGFFSNSLRHNGLRNDGSSVKMTGKLGLNLGGTFNLEIPVSNFVIFNESASNNQELSVTDGTTTQTVGTFPLTINYILKSTSIETLESYTTPAPDSKTYTNVKKVKMLMNMEVTSTYEVAPGFSLPITIMDAQDVVLSTQYYAKNIGMVYTNTVIDYELNALPGGATLPIPSSGTQVQDEFLDIYSVE
ncbi:MAG: hypothetical protein V4548_05795 [Bacteroidota bacterium]